MGLQIQIVSKELPEDFQELLHAAQSEGHGLLDRLKREWSESSVRFDGSNEKLLIARVDGKLVAVGGITVDPVDPSALRMRRFYVLPAARRRGLARSLVTALLSTVPANQSVGVHVGIPTAFPFWESVGFAKVPGEKITHRWVRAS